MKEGKTLKLNRSLEKKQTMDTVEISKHRSRLKLKGITVKRSIKVQLHALPTCLALILIIIHSIR